jgi:hypothetical protein
MGVPIQVGWKRVGFILLRDHRALNPQLRHLPVENVVRRPSLIAGPQLIDRTELLHQPANRIVTVGDRSRLRTEPSGSAIVSAWTSKPKNRTFSFMTGSSPRVALNCVPFGSQLNPRPAQWTGHSMMTKATPNLQGDNLLANDFRGSQILRGLSFPCPVSAFLNLERPNAHR